MFPQLFTPSKLRFVLFCSQGCHERELATCDHSILQPLIDLGMLMISQFHYPEGELRLERKILWQRPGYGSDETEVMLNTFDSFYTKAGMPIPVLEGALFVLPQDPFAIEQIFSELQKIGYTPQKMLHYERGAYLQLSQGHLLDAAYMSFQIIMAEIITKRISED